MAATHAFWLSLFRKDLLRDFSESPVTAVSPGAEGTPLVKGPERRPKWKPRRFRCQRETILHWLRVGFGPFAMASPTTPAENPMVKPKLRGLALLRIFWSSERPPKHKTADQWA